MSNQFHPSVSREFAESTADALRRLYDVPALLRNPLTDALRSHGSSAEGRARFLRTALLEAIEALNPGPRVPFRSPASRSYDALRLHYVEGRTVEEVARELAVSERQAYRDIRRGEADVAAILWSRHGPALEAPAASAAVTAHDEVDRVGLRSGNINIGVPLREALESVAPLAAQLGRELPALDEPLPTVSADAAALRQCLTALLSCALQAGSGRAELAIGWATDEVTVAISVHGCRGRLEPSHARLLETTAALAKAMGGSLASTLGEGNLALRLRLPAAAEATVLVIDDNEGLVELFRRYLSNTGYRVIGAQDPARGIEVAAQEQPTAIVLDILMPGADGWQVLSRLKEDAGTAAIPVIVCSVFNDPALAQALGAAAFIAKPVSRRQLLGVLESLPPR